VAALSQAMSRFFGLAISFSNMNGNLCDAECPHFAALNIEISCAGVKTMIRGGSTQNRSAGNETWYANVMTDYSHI
jgi:hypothetical protein